MSRWRLAVIAPLAAWSLSACVVAPYYPAGEVVTDVAPPAPYAEVIPAIPFVGAMWIGGYWGWRGGGYHWVPGRWEQPRPGYYWRPHRWEPVMGRWHFRGGGWMQR
ncbi:MAG: hypothetical protein U1E89_02655 [Burkholderiaceae bacterium]